GAKATTDPWELCLQARRDVLNMDCPAFDDGESSRIITADRASRVRQGNGPEPRDEVQRVTLDVADYRVVCSAESSRILGNGIENRLDIGGRLTDDTKNLACRRLLLQGLGHLGVGLRQRFVLLLKLGEQAHILDGDDRLVREGLQQLNVPVREGTAPLPRDPDHSDRVALMEERDRDMASQAELTGRCTRELNRGLQVGHVHNDPVEDGPARREVATGSTRILTLDTVDGFAFDIVESGNS